MPRFKRTALATAVLTVVTLSRAEAQRTSFSMSEKPFATISRMFLKSETRDSMVELARTQVGVSYKMGAKAPGKAFDCSGLVQWLMERFDLDLPRTSRAQSREGIEIPKDPSQLLPGDLLFFGSGKSVTHVGIYVGEGKYVHAANRRVGVVEDTIPTGRQASTWWKGVRRIFAPDSVGVRPVPQLAFLKAKTVI